MHNEFIYPKHYKYDFQFWNSGRKGQILIVITLNKFQKKLLEILENLILYPMH